MVENVAVIVGVVVESFICIWSRSRSSVIVGVVVVLFNWSGIIVGVVVVLFNWSVELFIWSYRSRARHQAIHKTGIREFRDSHAEDIHTVVSFI